MRRSPAPLVAVLAVLSSAAVPAVSGAATTYTVRGAGFGHGVGMSQYGAEGMAREDLSHRRILARYYPGTQLGRAPTDRTRVLLLDGAPAAEVSGVGRIPGRRTLDPERTYRATAPPGGGSGLGTAAGRRVGRGPAPVALDRRGQPVWLGGRALSGV